MIKRFLLFIAVFCLSFISNSYAQNTLIASEKFENFNYIVSTNNVGVSSNSGANSWIINNQYNGSPFYPNTISQDSTFGGTINFPNGYYLHIHDTLIASNNTIANANYNPQSASDRFATINEFCTLGFNNVNIGYYYLCMGDSANAIGQVYYSINNGTWTALQGETYYNTYKWKKTELINPIFDNQGSVRIGFRWTNDTANTPPNSSFAIDDILIYGFFNNSSLAINIDSLELVPVCQNNNFIVNFSFSNASCGVGFYEVELSNNVGSFINSVSLGIFQLNNFETSQSLFLNLPSGTVAGNCYKIRIRRIDVVPNVISANSICFEVLSCPNTITTLSPVVLSNLIDTICVGSVIDVPFYSTGLFTNNNYVAQLSDSMGDFPINPNILGTLTNSQTYDPGMGSLPGIVAGLLSPLLHPIPPGCNYYIRVISINPTAISNLYGPFCIRNCDIETNNQQDIIACITTTTGYDTTAILDINQFDSTTIFASNNQFQFQLLSSLTFAVVNTSGIGFINATGDTMMPITIPNLSSLLALGIQPGLYYARVIATNSSNMWNNFGTLIRVIIGAPADVPLGVFGYDPNNFTGFIPLGDTVICLGSAVYFTMLPYNNSSDYVWTLNTQTNWSTDQYTGVLINQPGDFLMSVVETNYGCIGPNSDTARIHVLGNTGNSITGPPQVYANDTVQYSSSFNIYHTYDWACSNATIISENNNIFELEFTSPGNYQVTCTTSNICTSSSSLKNIIVYSGLGNDEIEEGKTIRLFNNISDGLFQIEIYEPNNLLYQIEVLQANGKVVYKAEISDAGARCNYDINLIDLPTGIYFLKVGSLKSLKVFKIIKV